MLMLAYMNDLAWEETIRTGKAHYWSRSRGKLWCKGEESGHVQLVREILLDCDPGYNPAEGGTGRRSGLSHRACELLLPSLR